MNSWELCSSQPTALGQTWCALVVYNGVGETGHNPVAKLYIYLTCSVILVSSRVWPVLEIWSPLSLFTPCLECKVHEHPIGGHLGSLITPILSYSIWSQHSVTTTAYGSHNFCCENWISHFNQPDQVTSKCVLKSLNFSQPGRKLTYGCMIWAAVSNYLIWLWG